MRVLIVGCGYVGVPLGAELVRLSHEVFGLRRSSSAEKEFKAVGIQPFIGDVTQLESFAKLPRNFDWVVNCVAAGSNADRYREVYLQGTQNLLAWLAPNPPKKFVYTSSTSVYGQNDGSQVDESSLTEPVAETSKILIETEKVLLAAVTEQKFPAVILRSAGIYGPMRGHAFKQFLQGEARIEGDGARILNMIHRDDLVGAVIASLKHGMPGEIYNAVDNEPVSQRDFYEWLAVELQLPPPGMLPALPASPRKRGATNKQVSNAKLRAELKYEFKFPDFRAGYRPLCAEARLR